MSRWRRTRPRPQCPAYSPPAMLRTRPIARQSPPPAWAAWRRSRPSASWHCMRAIAWRQSSLISLSLHHVSHHFGYHLMTFTLPNLPYAHDALAPHMSKETLEFHHSKHHQAYVTNGNNAIKGTEFEG